MKWLMRPFFGGVAACVLFACSTDPGVSAGGGAGSSGTSGGGGASSGSGKPGRPGSGGSSGSVMALPNADGGTTMTPGSMKMCGFQKHNLERLAPELLLTLDRSGSMRQMVEGSLNDRWTETTAALDEILMSTNAAVSWGLKMFPSTQKCEVVLEPEVAVAAMNYPAIGGKIKETLPNMDAGGTPTGLAVRNATAHLKTLTTKNPKYIVLATDGEPTCKDQPVQAITDAVGAGFRVFVVGIATAGTGAHRQLNEMAVAGGEARVGDPQYYAVANKADLVAALTQITQRVSNCVFPLDMKPPSPNDVAVNLGGKRLTKDVDWKYGANMGSIEVTGASCEMLKAGSVETVEIVFGCPNVPIP